MSETVIARSEATKQSTWRECKLGECIEVINGYAFKSQNFLEEQIENSLPVVKIKNVANGDVNLKAVQFHLFDKSLEKYLIQKNDVLIALTGNHPQAITQVVGEASKYKLDELAFLNQRVAKIKARENMSNDFLYYFLKDDASHDYLASQSSGSANQANISKNDIENMPISLPPLEEQKAIAEVLSSLDDKIDLLHRQNKTLEELAQTLFRQWFIEEANDDWEVVKLDDILTITSSKRVFYSEYVSNGVPFYRSKEIIELHNTGQTKGELYISEDRYNEIVDKFGPVVSGDILLTSVGTLGIPYRVNQDDRFYFKDGNLTWFKDFTKLSSLIILYWLKSDIGKEELDAIAIGSTQAALTINSLKSIQLALPPMGIINNLEEQLIVIDNKLQANLKQIKTLENMRDTLLPKLMSGEVRVSV